MSHAVKFPGDALSLAELSAAALDGDVVALGEGYVPTDAPETPWLRARSLAPALAPTLAATHALAAWVWGAHAECPTVLTVQRATEHRVNAAPRARVVYRDGFVGTDDLVWFGDVAVTTIARTVADLARSRDLAVITLMAFNHRTAVVEGLAWCLHHTRLPGVPKAIALLERLDAGPTTTA